MSRLFIVLAGLALLQCAPTPEKDLLSVAAPKDYLGASVTVDGTLRGALAHLDTPGTWFDSLLRRLYPDSPVHTVVVLNLFLPSTIKAGVHDVRVTLPSGKALVGKFTYPFKPGEHHCLLFPNTTGLAASDSCATNNP
jgi:hypothetical protein